jgi:hypothetical protein
VQRSPFIESDLLGRATLIVLLHAICFHLKCCDRIWRSTLETMYFQEMNAEIKRKMGAQREGHDLLAGDLEDRPLLVGALASLGATGAAAASAHALTSTAAVLLIGAAAGVGSRAATDLATGKLAAGLTAGARAGRAAALAFL